MSRVARRCLKIVAFVGGSVAIGAAPVKVERPASADSSVNADAPSNTDAQPVADPNATRSPTQSWPAFRGANAGVALAKLPEEWDGETGRNILWKSPVPLPGQNAPIVVGDAVYVCGATREKQSVFCFDVKTGALRWEKAVGNPDPSVPPTVLEDTGFAASTMASDGKRVYVIFATGDLAAFDPAGELVWQKKLGPLVSQYGFASSLLAWNDRVIIQLDQGVDAKAGTSALLCFDGATGNEAWRTPRPVGASWSSPILVDTPSGPQVITLADPWAIAYEPEAGKERWRAKLVYGDIAPSPAYANGVAFFTMENAETHAIRTDGVGDVTDTHANWHCDEPSPDIVSPLATDRFVFIALSNGIVICLDATTGKKLWEHDFEGRFCASPILVGNVVYLVQKDGVTQRFEAENTLKPLPTCALGEAVSATPAVANDRLFIRGTTHLFCIGKP